jgi:hypothetical protein
VLAEASTHDRTPIRRASVTLVGAGFRLRAKRFGETTYRLTGITRGEPTPSLFEPPAGVTVK